MDDIGVYGYIREFVFECLVLIVQYMVNILNEIGEV